MASVGLALAGPLGACHFTGMEWRTQRPAKRPGMIEPCIPTRATKPPVGPQWIHEIKNDGYRLIARKRDSRVRLFTRTTGPSATPASARR
jgi:ATP-dependent DNA ligase